MLAESIDDPARGPSLEDLRPAGLVHRRIPHALEMRVFDQLRNLIHEQAPDA